MQGKVYFFTSNPAGAQPWGPGEAVSAKVLQLADAWNVVSGSELVRLMLVGKKSFLFFSWRIRKIRKQP